MRQIFFEYNNKCHFPILSNKIEVEKYIKTLMNNVERYFNGLCDELIKACNIKNATNIE
ncbi:MULTISPECIES: hypothetical protein [Borreliella]|uniref:hypothetical protein n=1 Tax=Borreliella TaxID=64895 RepID=UPI0004293F0B|nr:MULTISPECIES: hypothetical protein [Borreliella]